jgi:hypothetical protein
MFTLEQLKAAYLAGFVASGEGWNWEYPFNNGGRNPEENQHWKLVRDEAIQFIEEQK